MPVLEAKGTEVELNDEGFMVDSAQWTPELAEVLAEKEGIGALTERHWKVITFCREDTAQTGQPPGLRRISKLSGVPTKQLYQLVSKGTPDMAYPGLILANAAHMSGIDATLFFTFWGLDVITEKSIDHLHVATVGNPSMHVPTMLGGLPGMESVASEVMKKQMEKLDIPSVREMIEILYDSGAKLYACQMAMDMFKRTLEDLVPQVEDVISAMDFFDKSEGAQVLFI